MELVYTGLAFLPSQLSLALPFLCLDGKTKVKPLRAERVMVAY